MEDLKDVVTDIEQLNPTRKTRHHLKTARLICQILHIVDPAEADEYPDVTRAAMKFYVNNFRFYCPRVPHNVIEAPIYSEPSALTFITNTCTTMLYYCLKFNSTIFANSDIFKLLELCNEKSLRNVEAILTLSARLNTTGALGPQYQLQFCKTPKNCCTLYMLYVLLDLGMVQTVVQLFKHTPSLREPQESALSEPMELLLTAIKQPPSLLHLARLAVRKCMRDVHVLEDCYKLPIPCHLQDYLSFRSLNAEIRLFFIKKEKPSPIDYTMYNPKYEVLSRCGLHDTIEPTEMGIRLCYDSM